VLRLLVGFILPMNLCVFLKAQSDSNNSGHGDSNGFPLNTVDEAETGLGESNAFILDTGGDDGTPKSGHGNSAGFVLDTRAGGDTGSVVDPDQTGASESGAFVLDTSDGNATPPDMITGFADSGGFILDTYDPDPFQNTGHGDSGGFVLDTGGDDGIIKTGMSDSGGFTLDTRDSTGDDNNQSEFGFGDSNGFVLSTADGATSLAKISGTVAYDGIVQGPAIVWALDENDTVVAQQILPNGYGSFEIQVPKLTSYDFKVFIDGLGNGNPSAAAPWKHYLDWNASAGGFNRLLCRSRSEWNRFCSLGWRSGSGWISQLARAYCGYQSKRCQFHPGSGFWTDCPLDF
jgi:hypothetical protein